VWCRACKNVFAFLLLSFFSPSFLFSVEKLIYLFWKCTYMARASSFLPLSPVSSAMCRRVDMYSTNVGGGRRPAALSAMREIHSREVPGRIECQSLAVARRRSRGGVWCATGGGRQVAACPFCSFVARRRSRGGAISTTGIYASTPADRRQRRGRNTRGLLLGRWGCFRFRRLDKPRGSRGVCGACARWTAIAPARPRECQAAGFYPVAEIRNSIPPPCVDVE